MKSRMILASAVAASLGTVDAGASTYTMSLVAVRQHSSGGAVSATISSSTATWSYDDATDVLLQTGGLFDFRFRITPTSTLFRHSITGLIVGNGASAAASSFVCTEGNFGPGVGASICGNYNFGANLANESSITWGPATSWTRTIGGDDMALGAPSDVHTYDGFDTMSWDGHTLVIGNAVCSPSGFGGTAICGTGPYPNGFNAGYSFVLEAAAVPVPAAMWLFGSAVGVLGLMRRKVRGGSANA